MSAVIECSGLSKWYGDVIAVNDLNVEIGPGITGLLGPNGAGKSTLMKLTMGLAAPSHGSITVLGESPWDNPRLLARIGYVPEGDPPWQDQPGRRVAALSARLAGLSGAEADNAVEYALDKVALQDAADRPVRTYSRGMRQRLKFGLALLHNPEVLVLDEPLLGADPITRRRLLELIRELGQRGASVLISTHVLPDVETLTRRILLMNSGRRVAFGEVGEIRDWLERYPRTVRIATPDPRALGRALWEWPTVQSVQAEEGAVLVRTQTPQAFYERLQEHLSTNNVPFTSITSPDDSVEAVFRYLVG